MVPLSDNLKTRRIHEVGFTVASLAGGKKSQQKSYMAKPNTWGFVQITHYITPESSLVDEGKSGDKWCHKVVLMY